MSMKKYFLSAVLFAMIAIGFSSCKKIQEDNLVNGLWRFNQVYIGGSTTNYLTGFPSYTNGNNCCAYKVDFQRDDIVFAYYITYDTFGYVVGGNWHLDEYNKIQLHFDNYFDGTFDMKKTTQKQFELNSDANHIKFYDGIDPNLDTTTTKIEMERI